MRWMFVGSTSDGLYDITSTPEDTVSYAQPAALWSKRIGNSVAGWRRTHLQRPVDPMPEDQVWKDSGGTKVPYFLLRECEGMLSDGWGQQLWVYAESFESDSSPSNLIVVSGGADREIDYANIDSDSGANSDNLTMRINRADWDYHDEKRERTFALLEEVREAIIGSDALHVAGAPYHRGFIADIGNPEPLTGDYVRDGNRVYRCTTSHKMGNFFPVATDQKWDEVFTDNTTDTIDAKRFPQWAQDQIYHAPAPYLLQTSGTLVWHKSQLYRAIADTTGVEPGNESQSWQNCWVVERGIDLKEADSSLFPWANGSSVRHLPLLKQDTASQLYIGWRKKYLRGPRSFPLSDSWGRPIDIALDSLRAIILHSNGPNGIDSGGVDDDIRLTIHRHEYECVLKVVRDSIKITTADTLHLYKAKNGLVDTLSIAAKASGGDALFILDSALAQGRVSGVIHLSNSDTVRFFTKSISPTLDENVITVK